VRIGRRSPAYQKSPNVATHASSFLEISAWLRAVKAICVSLLTPHRLSNILTERQRGASFVMPCLQSHRAHGAIGFDDHPLSARTARPSGMVM